MIRYREKSENVSEREREKKFLTLLTPSHANYRNTCYNYYLKLVYASLIEHEASIKDDYYRGNANKDIAETRVVKTRAWRRGLPRGGGRVV